MNHDPSELKEIGRRIKTARGVRTQSWLAERVKTRTSAISNIEKGVRPVPTAKILLFARVLEVEPSTITPSASYSTKQSLAELSDMGFALRDLKVLPEEAKKQLVEYYNELKLKYQSGKTMVQKDPSDIAAELLRSCGIVRPPVDLARILTKHGIEAKASSTIASDGWIVYSKANGWAGIKYREGMSPGRIRFTIAHELGHFFLRGEEDVEVSCTLDGREVNREHERQADLFASNLLMPKDWVCKENCGVLQGISDILKISNKFEVSQTAAAIRLVQLTKQACAVIYSVDGKVQWARSSPALYTRVKREMGLPKTSQAARVLSGGRAKAPQKTDSGKWFENKVTGDFLEHSASLYAGTVLTLVWTR